MKPARKKLLAAAVGVAAINYYGCQTNATSGNLMVPTPEDAGAEDATADQFISSGNLMAPPGDAGTDADAGSDSATSDSGGADAKTD